MKARVSTEASQVKSARVDSSARRANSPNSSVAFNSVFRGSLGNQAVQRMLQSDPSAPAVDHPSREDEPAIELEAPAGRGQPLPTPARAFFEPRFSHDFSGVRIHDGERSDAAARRVNARAYTYGSNIVFGDGQFNSDSAGGQRLLAHELTHVVQQGGSRALPAGVDSSPVTRDTANLQRMSGNYSLRVFSPSGEEIEEPFQRETISQSAAPSVQRTATFQNPTPTNEDPLARMMVGDTPGITIPTINGGTAAAAPDVATLISPQNLDMAESGGTTTCQLAPGYSITTSANVTIATNPGQQGWTGQIDPSTFDPPQPDCSSVSGTIPVTLVATPSNQDFATRVQQSEQEHVDALRELHDRFLVPFDTFVTGLQGSGPSPTDCQTNWMTQFGDRLTETAMAFSLGYAAETERLDGAQGTHTDTANLTLGPNCSSVTIEVSPAASPISGSSRGNVVTVAPTTTTFDHALLSVDGNNVIETPQGGGSTRVIQGFSSTAIATDALHVMQHYGMTSKNEIGPFTYWLAGTTAPAGTGGALSGVTEGNINPDTVQVIYGMPNATDWAVAQVAGVTIDIIDLFGTDRNEAYSAVDILRSYRFTKVGRIGPTGGSPEMKFFRL